MRKRWIVAGTALLLVSGCALGNASWLAPIPDGGPPLVLAHRGVHQDFNHTGLKLDGCTANRIFPPTNPYLENTIPSMEAGLSAGATALELDIHPTTDGEFAVFHDWRLECRTNGKGVTRDQTMAYLRTLDLGYGYTADGGKTFPFRGKGIGMMPTLHEVLVRFPTTRFLINIKSNDAYEADQLVAYLRKHGHPVDGRLWVFADGKKVGERLAALAPEAHVESRARGTRCAVEYLALGWSGHVPSICRSTTIGVPVNWRWAYWGWPNRFLARMKAARVEVTLVGPVGDGKEHGVGIDQPAQLDAVPPGFSGTIITDEVAQIGPEVRRRWPERR